LRWAIDNGMQICNLSLGTTRQEFHAELHELAELAYSHNVVLVAALSNLDVPSYPAACESVLAVTARPFADPHQISYSERPTPAFGARGLDVPVAWLNGGWRTMSGNSYAAPHVTGLVAQIVGKHPDLRAYEVRSILRALAVQANNQRKEVGFSSIAS
jgi:subtilisin